MPSKKTLTTTMVSSAWVDDELIIERKRGLAAYIDFLLGKPHFEEQSVFVKFLSPGSFSSEAIDTPLEMRFKDAATGPDRTFIAASYYPAWSSKENPPQEIKFSQFDIIFFGTLDAPFKSTSSPLCLSLRHSYWNIRDYLG